MNDLLKRSGTFEVSRDLIYKNPEGVLKALEGVLIVNLNDNFIHRSIIYSGFSIHFDIVEDGMMCPEYKPLITATEEDISIKWIRQGTYNENDIRVMLAEIKSAIRDNNIK